MMESITAPAMSTLVIPIVWSVIAGCCLAVAAVQLAAWMRARSDVASLAFGVLALSVTFLAFFELALMQAQTPAEYGHIQRWLHVPLFSATVSMVVFVRAYFGAGRMWLAVTICALRVIGLALDFAFEPNIEYRTITEIAKLHVLGEPASVAVGERNPWVALLSLSTFLLIAYVLDAALTLWRRGNVKDRRRALVTGGALLLGLCITVANATLMRLTGMLSLYIYSVPFALLLTAIASEISAEVAKSVELDGKLRESESALARSRRRMDQATQAASIGVWEWDIRRNEIWLDSSAREYLGFRPDKRVAFAQFQALLHPDDSDYVKAAVERSRIDGLSFEREYRVRSARYGYRWIHTRGASECDENGNAYLMRGVFFDVTGRREAAERFRLVVEAAANGLALLDPEGRIKLTNASTERILGLPREELLDRRVGDLLPLPPPAAPAAGNDAAPVAIVNAHEIIARRKDGAAVDVEVTTTPIRTSSGVEVLVSMVDIGERKRRDAALRIERAFLRQVIDIDPNLIFAKDRSGRFTLANKAVAEIYGTTVEDLIGRTDADFNENAAEVDAFIAADHEVMDLQREQFIPEERVTDFMGNVHYLQTVKRPIVGEDGVAHQVLGVASDITARKHAELELERQRNELAHLARVTMVSELSGSIAHELNQPLAAILSNAEAARMLLERTPPDLQELAAILSDIVSDDLRAAQVIAGMRALLKKGDLRRENIDMAELVNDVLRLLHSDLINAGAAVKTRLAEGMPPVAGERVQLQQVLLNLIMNACDAMLANPPRKRELIVAAECTKAGVRVSVTDHGPGMSKQDIERAFEPFYSTKSHGLGLGLPICRSIIGAHGGQMEAMPGPSGMTFSFTLPVAYDEGTQIPDGTKGPLPEALRQE